MTFPIYLAQSFEGSQAVAGVFGIIVFGLLFLFALFWVILPFLLRGWISELRDKMNESNKLNRALLEAAQAAKVQSEQQLEALALISDQLTRANHLLDWGAQTAAGMISREVK